METSCPVQQLNSLGPWQRLMQLRLPQFFQLCVPNAPPVPLVQFLIGDSFADIVPETKTLASPGPIQMYCCDGSGLHGTGDWCFPPAGAVDTFGGLRRALLKAVVSMSLPQRLVAHSALADCKQSGSTTVAPCQPFTIYLLESLRRLGGFCDPTLASSLRDGVSTAVLAPWCLRADGQVAI